MENISTSEEEKTPKPLSSEELSIVGKSSKPNYSSLPQSSILSRLKNFLPQMEQANATIESTKIEGVGIDIERVVESSSDSDSDSSEDSESDEGEEMEEKEGEKRSIQMQLSLFKEGSRMEEDAEKSLPEAFRDNRDDVKETESPKKKLIEEV
ncbi:hypothetical protein PMAYCL1PPCAC_18390 [Pristionchus mayeri]|uniref:Uncharacterized protein n=1 Tax=Pristionchus mayeri TaxID=1317129 RepID=A0AAN5I1K5_9BILA|nr:hypothetical protein PMAYCL1PPCAC_18390 [Pristionchus mayeri]